MVYSLLLVVIVIVVTSLTLLGVLPLDTAGPSATEGRLEAEVNVLLGVEAHDEGGHVHHLLAHTNVSLADKDTSVVDRLGQSKLEDLGLKPALQEVLDLEAEHVIELHLTLVKHADTHQTTQKRVTLEQSALVLLLQGEQLSGGGPDLGQGELHAPHLTLVTQTILADELQLLVEAGLL